MLKVANSALTLSIFAAGMAAAVMFSAPALAQGASSCHGVVVPPHDEFSETPAFEAMFPDSCEEFNEPNDISGGGQSATLAGVSQGVTRSQVQNSINVVSTRVQSFSRDIARSLAGGGQAFEQEPRSGYHSGLAAGSADKMWGFWADGSGSYLSNDGTIANSEGYGVSALAGFDYNLDRRWLFGFDAGYVRTDLNVLALAGHRTADGAQFGPYMSYIFNKNFTIDGIFNYTRVSNTAFGLTSFNSNRFTAAVNLNGFTDVDGYSLTGFLGYVYAFENPDTSNAPAFIGALPTTVHYGAVKIGGEVAYPMGNFEPYVPVTVEVDTTQPRDGTGRAGVTFGVGTRYQVDDSVKIGFVATTEQARSHSQNVVGAANLRVVF